ncbi:ABC transporter substrate-binding protein [Clostridia bacterium]|nr:ABC transporter substrate-binding protein [Clostridia bacterium]
MHKHDGRTRGMILPKAWLSALLATLLVAFVPAVTVTLDGADAQAQSQTQDQPVVFTCFINHTWYPVDSFSGIIPQEITRRIGVALDVTIAKDSRHLNMLLASGDLPDLIFSSLQFGTLSDARYCLDYDGLLAKYNVDWDISDDLRANALSFSRDGKVYTVINHYTNTQDWQDTAAVPMTSSLMVRQDMLDAMDNPPLRTLDDLMAVYLRVRELYPDVMPLTFDMDHRFNVFRVYFGLGLTEFVQQPDGSYAYYVRDERYREMLSYLNKLYQNDCLLAENFATTHGDALYRKGKAFSHTGCTQNLNLPLETALRKLDPSYRSVELMPLEGSSYADSQLGWSGVFITTENHDPQTAIEFVRWMFTPEAQRLTQWGRDGVEYVLTENGLPVFSQAVLDTLENATFDRTYNPWFHLGASAIIESEGRCAFLNFPAYSDTYTRIRELYQNQPWIAAATPLVGTPEKDVYDRVTDITLMWETKLIVSESDEVFELNYNEYMRALTAMNIEALEASVTNSIPTLMEHYSAQSGGAL